MAGNGVSLACAVTARRLAADPDLNDDHVATCLRCQVEALRYRSLVRQLAELRAQTTSAPVGFPGAVRTGLGRETSVSKKPSGREAAVAAAGLAAVAGAVALWRRSLTA
ncbi:MAG: hypothetical protein HKN80_11350 [Acidimicrobiia bacterium]|nr:hypothetical protein [Acidimicrobiia bacterium]